MNKEERLDAYNEAYVIVGMLGNGRKMYYTYDYDKEDIIDAYDFTFSVFDACLYNTLNEADTFMRHIRDAKKKYADRKKHCNIESIHIEKFTTIKLEDDHEMVL